jgi:tripartite-type tricarboxylate transporter receptor subunit TctC
MIKTLARFVLGIGALCTCVGAGAQSSYPDKPIRLIVPYTAGGVTDGLTRGLAELMRPYLNNQTIIVENKPGANTAVAAQFMATAKPDGYTIMFITPATVVMNPLLVKNLGYNPDRDLTTIARFADIPFVTVVSTTSKYKTLAELLDAARAQPGRFNYSSTGTGSSIHLATLLLEEQSKTQMVHIPFSGSSPSLTAVVAGDIQFTIDPPAGSLPLIKGGKLRALAVSSASRLKALPDVPTIAESGYPGFEVSSWAGIVGPANLPKEIVAKLNHAVNAAAQNPEFRSKFENLGVIFSEPLTPEQVQASIVAERAKWDRIIKANKLDPQ